MDHQSTRNNIINAADQLFYQQGYEHTSFADIAGDVRISRGNFYYHFKTKDDILKAVIKARLENTKKMLAQWEAKSTDPKERIRLFMGILLQNRSKIMQYGCPVGTLCNELAKLDHAALPEATMLFTLFREWLRDQFLQLGFGETADALAMHVLARSQGVATLATAFSDADFIRNELNCFKQWLDGLNPKEKDRLCS